MLLRLDVWGLAAGQIIFSLSPGMGTAISLASFNKRSYRGLKVDFAVHPKENVPAPTYSADTHER